MSSLPSRPRAAPRGDWLILLGAAILFVSLFLTWTHEYPASLDSLPEMRLALGAIPMNASAWQVYSTTDVLLAALAVALVAVALRHPARGRVSLAVACAVALEFTVHAIAAAPTSGADVLLPGSTRYVSTLATSGAGEPVALAGLALALVGLAASFVAG